MSINLRLAGRTAAVIIWIVVVAVLLTGRNNHNPPAAATTGTTTTSSAGKSSSVTQGQNPRVTKRQAGKTNEATNRNAEELAKRTQGFMSAYYLIKPEDTQMSRRSRVARFVDRKALPLLDLGLSSGTAADTARTSKRLTLSGKVVLRNFSAGPSAAGPKQWLVYVPVVISVTKPDGRKLRSFVVHTSSLWKHVQGRWFLVNFDKGAGDAG